MAYSTISEVVSEFTPSLRNSMERDYGEAFEEIISGHISKADDFVNASLARAYSVPLKRASSIVITAESKLAAYYSAAAYSEKEEVLKDKYETAVKMLDYLVEANNPALVDEEEKDFSRVLYGTDERIFSSDELSKW